MALSNAENKAVLEAVWRQVDALPNHGFGRVALTRLVEKEHDRVTLKKQGAMTLTPPQA